MRKLKALTKGQCMNIPLKKWSGSEATEALHKSILEFNTETSRQARTMIFLTWVIAVLTLVMLILVGVQIWLAVNGTR